MAKIYYVNKLMQAFIYILYSNPNKHVCKHKNINQIFKANKNLMSTRNELYYSTIVYLDCIETNC